MSDKNLKARLNRMVPPSLIMAAWTASSVDRLIFVNPAPAGFVNQTLRVVSVAANVEVAGTHGSDVTLTINKVASGAAIATGTPILAAAMNLKSTAGSVLTPALVTTDALLWLSPGDALAFDFTGTLTAAIGIVGILLVPE